MYQARIVGSKCLSHVCSTLLGLQTWQGVLVETLETQSSSLLSRRGMQSVLWSWGLQSTGLPLFSEFKSNQKNVPVWNFKSYFNFEQKNNLEKIALFTSNYSELSNFHNTMKWDRQKIGTYFGMVHPSIHPYRFYCVIIIQAFQFNLIT